MVWRRPADEYAREHAEEARRVAEVARASISQHMIECTQRYEELKRMGAERHGDNQRRIDTQDRMLTRILWAVITALAMIVMLGIERVVGGHH